MKTFKRILSYAGALNVLAPSYFFFAIFGVVLGVVNLVLLIPLFEVIFDQISPEEIAKFRLKPEMEWQLTDISQMVSFFKDSFYYYFVRYIDESGKVGALFFVCVLLVIANLLSNFFKYFSVLIISFARIRLVRNMRVAVYNKISNLHLGFFNKHQKGDIISRLIGDVGELDIMIMYSFQILLKEPISVMIHLTFLFVISAKLTLVSLFILPLAGFFISALAKKLKSQSIILQDMNGQVFSFLDETLGGMRIIKAFTAEKYVQDKFRQKHTLLSDLGFSFSRRLELASPISEFLGIFFLSGILLYGGMLVLEGDLMAPATFFTYLFIFAKLLEPTKEISKAYSSIQKGLVSAQRVFFLLDMEQGITDKDERVEAKDLEDKIAFKVASFSYGEDAVLSQIHFELRKGKTIALVGPSGGGKSTIADLLPRFYDIVDGEITWDGKPIKTLKKTSFRKHLGIVTQESILFNDSIYKNIAFGLGDVPLEEVIESAKIANAHDFITALPQGYDTVIGERGSRLSGGQRQRVSIARAVLKNPSVLILDEATSALDTESEKLVQDALKNLMNNRTTLVIAHRLSTIQHADEILVIENGEIVQRGNHQTLLNEEGLYQKLITMQSSET